MTHFTLPQYLRDFRVNNPKLLSCNPPNCAIADQVIVRSLGPGVEMGSIAIDVAGRKLYYSYISIDEVRIRRLNLDDLAAEHAVIYERTCVPNGALTGHIGVNSAGTQLYAWIVCSSNEDSIFTFDLTDRLQLHQHRRQIRPWLHE